LNDLVNDRAGFSEVSDRLHMLARECFLDELAQPPFLASSRLFFTGVCKREFAESKRFSSVSVHDGEPGGKSPQRLLPT
jgi:hypothetical protein